ncbi:MAG: hypothetical protein ACRCZI_09805 [Cetobacterium sp.]
MTITIETEPSWNTNQLLAVILSHAKTGEHVQFLVEPRAAESVVQRLRVALSRSRNRNKGLGKKVEEFALRHEIYPYTKDGKRFSCIVMWVEKQPHHVARELLDDLMERES